MKRLEVLATLEELLRGGSNITYRLRYFFKLFGIPLFKSTKFLIHVEDYRDISLGFLFKKTGAWSKSYLLKIDSMGCIRAGYWAGDLVPSVMDDEELEQIREVFFKDLGAFDDLQKETLEF